MRRIIVCVTPLIFAASLSGCGKAVVQTVGKSVVKTFTKAPRFVRGELRDMAIETAYDAVTSDKPSMSKPAQNLSSKPVAAVGAAVAGGAVVANEMLSDDKHRIKASNNDTLIERIE